MQAENCFGHLINVLYMILKYYVYTVRHRNNIKTIIVWHGWLSVFKNCMFELLKERSVSLDY